MRSPLRAMLLLAALAGAGTRAEPAHAQSADFLFRKPVASLAVRGGWSVPRARSEIFEFTGQQLGVRRNGELVPVRGGDFAGPTVQLDLGVALRPRLEAVVGVGVATHQVDSESLDYVGTDDLPIEQSTRLLRVPVTAGLKLYLTDRGRAVGRFAWVPAAWSPWVGAGAGGTYSEFEQKGEFVDYETLDIFPRTFRSTGFSRSAYLAGGADLSLGPHLLATGEARYAWSHAAMDDDFVNFDPIDLSGFQLTAGLAVRF